MAPGLLERVVDLAILTAATGASQLIRADNVEAVAGEIQVLVGQLRAGGHVQHHKIIVRMRAHPQEQRLFILFNRFIIKERQRTTGVEAFIIEQAAAAIHDPGKNKFKTGTSGERRLLASEQLQPAGADIAFAKQHQANAFFRAEQRLMQPLNKAFRRPGAQHRNQADALF